MVGSRCRKAAAGVILGSFLAAGCAEQVQYRSPAAQEESSPAYRTLYPGGFGPEGGPSATSSGDE